MFSTWGALIGLAIAIALIVRKATPAYALVLGALLGGLLGGGGLPETVGAMIGGAQSPSRYYPVSLAATDARKERYVYGAPDPPAVAYPALQRHEVVFNDTDQNVSVDGVLLSTFSTDFKTSNAPMYIFAASKTNLKADWFSKSRRTII